MYPASRIQFFCRIFGASAEGQVYRLNNFRRGTGSRLYVSELIVRVFLQVIDSHSVKRGRLKNDGNEVTCNVIIIRFEWQKIEINNDKTAL